MAEQGYNIGQYRYAGTGCVSVIDSSINYEGVSVGEGDAATTFQDLVITQQSGGQFSRNQDYYLSIKIPQDMNYDLSFNVKLTKDDSEGGSSAEYQFIKTVSISRGGSGSNVYNVVLYETSNGDTKAMIPLPYIAGSPSIKDYVYQNESTKKYYLGLGGTSYNSNFDDYNEISVLASWKQESAGNFATFEFIFRPIEDGFSKILISMLRDASDYSIQRINDQGSIEYGRKVDKNLVQFELLRVNNLVNNINRDGTLSRIGVWSHPGLPMCINGEEIKVGSSGYYELDALPITSLGIVARDGDYNSNFTVDYAYQVEK